MLFVNDGSSGRQTVEPLGRTPPRGVWVDLLNPNDDERACAERITGLRVPSRDEISEIESSSRVYSEDGVGFFNVPYSFLGPDGRSHTTPVGFVLGESHLMTVRFESLPAFDQFAERYAHGGPKGAPETFVGLVEAIVDRMADVLERIATALDGLSKQTFLDAAARKNIRRADLELRELLNRVGRTGDSLAHLRDMVLGLGRIVGYAQQIGEHWAPIELKPRLQTLRQDITSLNDYDQQLNAKVSFLLDAVLGFINIEQNNGVKVLTVVSVVGIPPTFVVGLYGMNFKNMPEYDWAYGYQFGWAMILLSIIVPIVWFRVKGWI